MYTEPGSLLVTGVNYLCRWDSSNPNSYWTGPIYTFRQVGNAWYLNLFISFKTVNILVRCACSIFVGRQINYLHAFVGTKDIGRLHEAAISAPWEEIAKFRESKARACGQGELLIRRRKVGGTKDTAGARSRRAITLEEDTAPQSHRGICIQLWLAKVKTWLPK